MTFIRSFFVSFILACVTFYSAVLILIDAPVKAAYSNGEMITIKKELVKEYAGKNKIIITGGSSSLFGFDTEYATKALDMPVINFGLTAGLMLEKILNEISSVIERGDFLILALEPTYYECGSKPKLTSLQVADVIGWEHDAWNEMNRTERLEFISLVSPTLLGEMFVAEIQKNFYPDLISDRLAALDESLVLSRFHARTAPTEFAYSAYNLNGHGDILRTEGAKYKGPVSDVSKPRYACNKTARTLILFVDRMKKRGVQVFFANTPYLASKTSFDTWKSSEINFENELASIGCFIDSREDLTFDRKYFFNTSLHLNTEGRSLRTDAFIKAVRKNVLTGKCGLSEIH